MDLKQTEHELVYDYEDLRLNPSVLDGRSLESYKFRLNETSRFYMALGMHMFTYQLTLKVSEMSDVSGLSYQGKQEFNLNIIDTVLGPGDYNL